MLLIMMSFFHTISEAKKPQRNPKQRSSKNADLSIDHLIAFLSLLLVYLCSIYFKIWEQISVCKLIMNDVFVHFVDVESLL